MIILDVNRVEKDFGYGTLFKDLSFSLNEGESISIVGPNGCGKSTLLKIIAGIEKADKGTVSIKKGINVSYLDQTGSSIDDDRIVYDILKSVFASLNEMNARIEKYQKELENNLDENEYNRVLEKYCSLIEKFERLGGYDIDLNINTVVEGLNIRKEILNERYNDLSGGEKTLVQLARTLLTKPELLLLDEPTNHLDIDRIEWLESYIKSFRGASVIISHDRYFLDKMSTKILSLDNIESKVYNTNYTGYLEEKEREFEKQVADYTNQQNMLKRLEEQRKYFAQRGMATNSTTLCNRAHALQTQIERIKKNAIERPKKDKKINASFSEERKSSKEVISVKNLTVEIPNDRVILDNVSVNIYSKHRVALLGQNGSGKTTFVKTVLGSQTLPYSGEIEIGPSVKIGYLPQIINFPNEDEKLLDYFRGVVLVSEERARKILANFEFYKDDVVKPVKNLSGGEKMKVKLAELLEKKINTLILDEPTNHIDIPTKEVLENALEDFDGTLIFVSHDRYFINKFADEILEFKNGKITPYIGNYDYYKETREKNKE